ncbi:MAG: recombinase family protein [Pseudomonadota bacterium]|nr:recombinase family protein [Pseudomonadota bacterium]
MGRKIGRLVLSLADILSLRMIRPSEEIDFESLPENIDTSNSSGELIFHIFADLAQIERPTISERTKASFVDASACGHKLAELAKLKLGDGRAITIP